MAMAKTQQGEVQGIDGEGLETYLGLPYAAPPVGDLRWQPPASPEPWTGTFDATRHPNRCIQIPYMDVLANRDIPGQESEDCLYLNIFTPAADGKQRPVMFWIHGGAYIQGAANEYDPEILARDNDVVVVTINYRLGIFGFLDLSSFGETFKGSAALGFQDQIAALKWARDNIENFGGDPGNVTIFGESAGGGSVLALLAAPSAKGLFHKAIGHSPGEVFGPPMDNVPALAALLGLEGPALLEKLIELPAPEVFALQLGGAVQMGASVDGTIVTSQPSAALKDGAAKDIPLIVGLTRTKELFWSTRFPKRAGRCSPWL